jgi:NAD(P)-dependent dehydrogenase (short-subunit alcohol dehydrogenase family)
VEAMADGFRRELAHDGIKVTLVEPGSFSTNIIDEVPATIQQLEQGETTDDGAPNPPFAHARF